jgi:aldehyde:ferredoxin oxidoreductase
MFTPNASSTFKGSSGHRVPQDDYPPEFNFTEPLGSGIHGGKMIMAGPGARPVDMTGNTLDRDKFKAILKEYYQLRGWDVKTGLPTKTTLTALGMDDISVK